MLIKLEKIMIWKNRNKPVTQILDAPIALQTRTLTNPMGPKKKFGCTSVYSSKQKKVILHSFI